MTWDLNDRLQKIRRDQFNHLNNHPISVTDAMVKYAVVRRRNIDRWLEKGYIRQLRAGYRQLLDEGDMAYCAAIYHVRREYHITSVPLLDEDGKPYLIRFPDISQYRRKKRPKISTTVPGKN